MRGRVALLLGLSFLCAVACDDATTSSPDGSTADGAADTPDAGPICEGEGASCQSETCCEGMTCEAGICKADTCLEAGSVCVGASEGPGACCAPAECWVTGGAGGMQCVDATGCSNDLCDGDTPCCPGQGCAGGQCQPLP